MLWMNLSPMAFLLSGRVESPTNDSAPGVSPGTGTALTTFCPWEGPLSRAFSWYVASDLWVSERARTASMVVTSRSRQETHALVVLSKAEVPCAHRDLRLRSPTTSQDSCSGSPLAALMETLRMRDTLRRISASIVTQIRNGRMSLPLSALSR